MIRFLRFFLPIVILALFVGESEAVPRNPPPVFETEYTLPTTATPGPVTSVAFEHFTAVGLYALFLTLAVAAAFRWRSRKILFLLAVASVVLLGFRMQGCPCPVGMFQNIVDALLKPFPFLPWTVLILFTLPLLVALFYGRVFCSSVCPLGALQELTALKPIRIPDGLEQALGLFRYVWLGLGVFFVVTGLGYLVCRFDPYVGLFRFGGLYPVMLFSGVMLLIGIFVGRPFCRFLCPYGALLGLCGSVSAKKVSVAPGECTKCRLCEEICPYNAILRPTPPPDARRRKRGLRRFLASLSALPVLILLFAFLGSKIAPTLSGWNFEVRTAELLYAEDQRWTDAHGTFSETRAVIQAGVPYEDVYRQALEKIRTFRVAGFWLGVWIGTVIGVKLVFLTLRRRRTEYEVDPARCVACGRCFWYCPNQKNERFLLTDEISRNSSSEHEASASV